MGIRTQELKDYLDRHHPGKWSELSDQPFSLPIECSCGMRGDACELLTRDNDQTLRCPECGSAGWVYALV